MKLWVCCFDIVRNHFFTGRQSVCIFRKILKRFHHLHLSSKYTWYFFALFELSGGFGPHGFFLHKLCNQFDREFNELCNYYYFGR